MHHETGRKTGYPRHVKHTSVRPAGALDERIGGVIPETLQREVVEWREKHTISFPSPFDLRREGLSVAAA